MLAYVAALLREGDVITVDGKVLRGTFDVDEIARMRMTVSPDVARLRPTLASVPADQRVELEAAIEAFGLIALKAKVGTADVLRCNRRTVAKIKAGVGDWWMAFTANEESLRSVAQACFGDRPYAHPSAVSEYDSHSRADTRTTAVVSSKTLG